MQSIDHRSSLSASPKAVVPGHLDDSTHTIAGIQTLALQSHPMRASRQLPQPGQDNAPGESCGPVEAVPGTKGHMVFELKGPTRHTRFGMFN